MDAKLTADGDIDLSTGDYQLLEGAAAIAQHIKISLSIFLGEWFLDERVGFPWLQKILGQKQRESVVRAIFRAHILAVPGVASITDFLVDFDGATRKLSVSFNGTTTDGEPLEFDEEIIVG